MFLKPFKVLVISGDGPTACLTLLYVISYYIFLIVLQSLGKQTVYAFLLITMLVLYLEIMV